MTVPLFESLDALRHARHAGTGLALSVLAHAAATAALLLVPLIIGSRPPDPPAAAVVAFLCYDPPPPPPPPLMRGPGLSPRPAPATAPRTPPPETTEPAPTTAPVVPTAPSAAAETPVEATGGDPSGSLSGSALGMPGGVEGGVVGGVPGGVLGGVIGGTGTGPAPIPVKLPDRPARLLRMTRPKYPHDAFVAKLQGTVLLEILIDERGAVVRARVLQSIPQLDAAATEAVLSWAFLPAEHQGRPVASLARAPISFRIY